MATLVPLAQREGSNLSQVYINRPNKTKKEV